MPILEEENATAASAIIVQGSAQPTNNDYGGIDPDGKKGGEKDRPSIYVLIVRVYLTRAMVDLALRDRQVDDDDFPAAFSPRLNVLGVIHPKKEEKKVLLSFLLFSHTRTP